MVSWDYFVGFEKKPRNLDGFLDKQGYGKVPSEGNSSDRHFESREGGLVELFFYEITKVKEGEDPDWKKSGFNVTFELMISTKDGDAAENALRLANETVRKYNGVIYASTSDEYFNGAII